MQVATSLKLGIGYGTQGHVAKRARVPALCCREVLALLSRSLSIPTSMIHFQSSHRQTVESYLVYNFLNKFLRNVPVIKVDLRQRPAPAQA